MAQSKRLLIAALALPFCLPGASAQENTRPAPAPSSERKGPPAGPDQFVAMQHVRRTLEGLTPEQRKMFAENLMRWANLSPEDKQTLREREAMRQRFIEKEVEEAIRASGLPLEGERRAQFVRRFTEERRKLEEQLQRETMEKRRPLVRELVSRLKAEFAEPKP